MMKFASVAQVVGVMCVALGAASSASAATLVPITDLYNTGMSTPWNAAQVPYAGTDPKLAGTPVVEDDHWDVAYDPAGATPLGPYTDTRLLDDRNSTDTANVNPFLGNQFSRHQLDLDNDTNATANGYTQLNDSQWIKTLTAGVNSDQPGVYVYQTTFTTTMPLTSISISGFFRANTVLGIQLNSNPVVVPGGTQSPVPFIAPTGFSVTGTGGLTNTLTFYVNRNGTGLAALRVQFTNATFTVPEPSTICLSVLGLVGYGVTRLRRRQSVEAK